MASKESEEQRSSQASTRSKVRRPRRSPAEPSLLFGELAEVAGDPNPANALRRALAAADRLFRPRSCFVAIHDPGLDRLQIRAARGRADRRVVAVARGEGAVGKAFDGGALEVDDGVVAVPMRAAGEPVGALALIGASWTEGKGPNDEEASQLAALANAAGATVALAMGRSQLERSARELEAAAEQAREGDRTRDAILSHISHELRTPLTTIKAYLAMLSRERLGPLDEKQKNALAVSERNADRLLRLINDLLLTARLQSGKMTLDPKPLGLRSVLGEAIRFLQDDLDAAQARVELEAPEGEVFIRGNRDRLVEGFMHLLERGLRGSGEKAISLRLLPRGRTGAIEFCFSGLHLTQDEVDLLFDAFRLGSGPSNLGLSIARQIFELHGGQIGAEQTRRGLIFQVALPLYAGLVTGDPAPPLERRSGEILVVEDDDDCRNGIVDYLQAENFEVRAFSEGRSALERIQQVPPALVLLDLRIPGVDGAALIKEVREREQGQRTPIYVISGAIDAQAGTDAIWGERVDGVFEKPINFPYLLERVRECVRDQG